MLTAAEALPPVTGVESVPEKPVHAPSQALAHLRQFVIAVTVVLSITSVGVILYLLNNMSTLRTAPYFVPVNFDSIDLLGLAQPVIGLVATWGAWMPLFPRGGEEEGKQTRERGASRSAAMRADTKHSELA